MEIKAAESTDKREKIRNVALDIFARKGFAGTTIAEIATAAGVAEGTIYNYFRNKQDLFMTILEEQIVNEQLISNIQTSPEDIRGYLKTMIKERLEFGIANASTLWLLISEVRREPELRKRYYDHVLLRVSHLFEGLLTQGIAEGRFRDINPRIAVRSMISNIIGLIILCNLEKEAFGETFDSEEMATEVSEMFLSGILNNGTEKAKR